MKISCIPLSLAMVLFLAACGNGDPPGAVDTTSSGGPGGLLGSASAGKIAIEGSVVSGGNSTAIEGASVSIYQALDDSSKLLGQTISDGNGKFSLSISAGNSGKVYYAIASKGSKTVLMASLGSAPLQTVTINELTTVASAYAFAQFLTGQSVSGPQLSLQIAAGMAENLVSAQSGTASQAIQASPNAHETNAWSMLGTLGNILTSCVQESAFRNACDNLFSKAPTRDNVPVLPADTLQAILNIAHNPGANVSPIFNLGDAINSRSGTGVQPYSPSLSVLQGPDSSDFFQKLDAWTLAFKVNATGSVNAKGEEVCPFGGPANVAFDKNGYVWINNNVVQSTPHSAKCLIVLKPNGTPADGLPKGTPTSPLTGGGMLGAAFGIAIDKLGNIWSGNFGWGNNTDDIPVDGSVTKLSPSGAPLPPDAGLVGGTHRVQGTASDSKNNIWMASYDNSKVVIFPNGDPERAVEFSDKFNSNPFGLAISSDDSGWLTFPGSDTVAKYKFTPTNTLPLSREFSIPLEARSNPKGIAVDTQGNAWIVTGNNSTLYQISTDGTSVKAFKDRGLNGPWGVSVDARNNIWVANFGEKVNAGTRYSVVHLCGVTLANCPPDAKTGDIISPPGGYTLPSGGSEVLLKNGQPLYGGKPLAQPSYDPLMRLTSVNIDRAGNAWVANNWKPGSINDTLDANPGGDGMVIFIGVGAPTNGPAIGPSQPAR